MYQVKVLGFDGEEALLHDIRDNECQLVSPVLELELNKTGTFTFDVPPSHPHKDKIKKMASEIVVEQDGTPIYIGRPRTDTSNFYGVHTVACEGVLSYLLDSKVRPYSFHGSIRAMLEQFLNSHNAQVEERKRFKLGEVTVADENNTIVRSNSDFSDTLTAINDKLIKTHGGYLRVRFEEDGRYLDYLSDYGHVNSQVIEFGENLLDLTQYINSDELITAVIPVGAQTEEDGINGVKKRVDITSVNGGKDYLVDEKAVAQYGYIMGTVKFDDVTVPENLKKKGQAYLNEHCNPVHSLELSAVDLHLIDVNTEKIAVGDWVRVRSKPHGLDKLFLVSKLSLNLTNPAENTLSLGKVVDTFTSDSHKAQGEITDYVIQTAENTSSALLAAIENATELITGGKGGYVVIDRAEDGHPQGILILDAPSTEDAKKVIRLNKNGIGFSRSGINGPYRNAWTIDGSLVADFITTGTLNADLIKTGLLSSWNGQSEINLDTGIAKLAGSFLAADPNGGTVVGGVKYDTNGAGTSSEAKNRMWVYTDGGWALKVQASGNLSLEGSSLVHIRGPEEVTISVGSTRWTFGNNAIYRNSVQVVPAPASE